MPQNAIAIANDHAGTELKRVLAAMLADRGFQVVDLGTGGSDSVDYPDFAAAMAKALAEGKADRGLLICGTGIGIAMAANRFRNVRAAPVHDISTARLAREHNDANVIALGARFIGPELAKECLEVFLNTPFSGGRHVGRVAKMS
jgi:ribose 5-phosphate isomerase B